jgi:hypothetical protein
VLFRHTEGRGEGPLLKELYALDSLLCALTHTEKKYAFRALLQAKGYISEGKHLYLHDAFTVAKARVEKLLGL